MDVSTDTNKRKTLLALHECYLSLSTLRATNHVASTNRQKKSEAYNELFNKLSEANATRDLVVR
jgi:hypothetical protein